MLVIKTVSKFDNTFCESFLKNVIITFLTEMFFFVFNSFCKSFSTLTTLHKIFSIDIVLNLNYFKKFAFVISISLIIFFFLIFVNQATTFYNNIIVNLVVELNERATSVHS